MDFVPAHADAGDDVIRVVSILLACCGLLSGDGGAVLFHGTAGTFDVTVFSASDAVRTGMNDLSVMVQRRGGGNTVMDANVLLHLSRSVSGDITRVTAIATHAKAKNKTMYGAAMNAPSAGMWRLAVDVSAGGESGMAAQNIEVMPPLPPMATYWPYVAMVPFALLAFVINRKLRKRFLRRV